MVMEGDGCLWVDFGYGWREMADGFLCAVLVWE